MACLREGYAGGPVLVNVDGEYVREGASWGTAVLQLDGRYVRDLSGGVTMGYVDQSGVIWNMQQERLAVIEGDYIRDSWGLEILYWVDGEAGCSEKAAMTLAALKLQGKL